MSLPIYDIHREQTPGEKRDRSSKTYLRDDLRQRSALEPKARIPLGAEWNLHAAIELRLAGVRERQVLDLVLRRFLVPLLRDYYVRLLVVRTRRRVDSSNLLDEMRLRRRLLRTSTTPCTLRSVRRLREKNIKGETHPARKGSVDFLGRVLLDLTPFCIGEVLFIRRLE